MANTVESTNTGNPFVLTGMSRSGTSLSASLLQAGGVAMGQRQLKAHAGNAKGHFENMDFLDFHRAVLREKGAHHGGYVCQGEFSPMEREAEARGIVARNAEAAGDAGWGWKDPRTSLFLEFWQKMVPGAHFIFVYRSPWEVVDSIFRRGVTEDMYFKDRPREAVVVWAHYNRCIMSFVRRHPEQSLLMKLDTVTADPAGFIRTINERFGTQVKMPPEGMVEPRLLHQQKKDSVWQGLVARSCPEEMKVLAELDGMSGAEASGVAGGSGGGTAADDAALFQEWFDGHDRARRAAKRKKRIQRWLGIFGGGGKGKP